MQRSLKKFPNETWYYYTFYNSYDDEQREYRYERNTKQVERIQSTPNNCYERYQRHEQNSTMNYDIFIRNESSESKKNRKLDNCRC
jgi:hypothetical protein